jgi:predicted peptidase
MIRFKPILAVFLATALVAPVLAQMPMANPEGPRMDASARLAAAKERLAFRPDVNGVAGIEGQMANAPDVAPNIKANADALRAQAAATNMAGRKSEALRLLNQAVALLTGQDWASTAYSASLALDVATPVADNSATLIVSLRQLWAEAPAGKPMSVAFRMLEDKSGGAVIKDYGKLDFSGGDLITEPHRFPLTLRGVAPGHYRLEAALADGSKLLAMVDVVDGLHAKANDVVTQLGKIQGHESAKATIRYPLSLARAMNVHAREVLSFDFTAEIDRSYAILKELEAGHDVIERAKGDTKRAYFFADANDVVPYRIYVPTSWDGKARLPMIVALHGANNDENNMITRANGVMTKLAEERGYIIVSPLGYRINSSYGAMLPREPSGFGMIADNDARRLALSEQDVLNVADIVAKEYGTDPKRTYIMGNSMGGMGTWHLAAKYPARWAAAAPAAGGVNSDDFNYAALKAVPIMPVAGELDGARVSVEATIAKAKAAGVKPVYKYVPGGTHGSAIEMAMPEIFDFFAKNRKK